MTLTNNRTTGHPHRQNVPLTKNQSAGVYRKRWRKAKTSLAIAVISFAAIPVASAQNATASQPKFVPFGDFVQNLRGVRANEVMAAPKARVSTNTSVERMRQHLLSLYDGVSVGHSFVLGGQTADCVPINQQPTVRAMKIKSIAAPPNAPTAPAASASTDATTLPINAQVPQDQPADAFGNVAACGAGTIPVRRVTMDEMARFGSLREFFQKGPNGVGHAPIPGNFVPPATATHKYSFTYQYVNNWGDNTNINLWRPYVFTDIGEIFSLAQSWTIGTGAATQTAEVGWQNYPARVGTQSSVPFIYFTADGYNNTGCYDLTCSGFVQVDNTLTFGVPWAAQYYSVTNGAQWEANFTWEFWQGNWWLRYGTTWIGYYPGSIYQGGQLSRYSNLLEFGSESVGTTVWPAEGSGLWAANGANYAAYQRQLWYIAPNTSYSTYWDTLTPDQPSPACYSIDGPNYSSSDGVYFYFGGPGGAGCQ